MYDASHWTRILPDVEPLHLSLMDTLPEKDAIIERQRQPLRRHARETRLVRSHFSVTHPVTLPYENACKLLHAVPVITLRDKDG